MVDPRKLRTLLESSFNTSELQGLCVDLKIDYELLSGGNKADKTRELVGYLGRRGSIPDLVQECIRLRPNVDWSSCLQLPNEDDLSHVETIKSQGDKLIVAAKVPAVGTVYVDVTVLKPMIDAGQEINELVQSISYKLRMHGLIFSVARERALLPVGASLIGEFCWGDSNPYTVVWRKIEHEPQPEQTTRACPPVPNRHHRAHAYQDFTFLT